VVTRRQKIFFSDGICWFRDPARGLEINLHPMLSQARWRVNELCGLLGIPPRTFNRLVEDGLGTTGERWLRENRIVAASYLLLEGVKIHTLAARLGFSNNANFTREFRKLIGVSPSEFLRQERLRAERYLAGK
jgi:AraC-like DNA-binding protein